MTPDAILAAITAVGNAVAEACRLAQTEKGQQWIEQALRDRAAWDAWWQERRADLRKLLEVKP